MGELITCDNCQEIIPVNETLTYLTIYRDSGKYSKKIISPLESLQYINDIKNKTKKYVLCATCSDILYHLMVLRADQVEKLKRKFNNIIQQTKNYEIKKQFNNSFEIELNRLVVELPKIKNAHKLSNIYFVAKAGAGKTFSAKFLIQKYNFEVAKFAYPVYMIAEKYFKMTDKDRKLLQIIGTDAGRDNINDQIWVNRFKEDMRIVKLTAEKLNRPVPKFVMDDCRFPNEHKVLKELGFVGIYLDVPDEIRKERLIGRDGTAQENTLNHKSETLIDTFKDDLIVIDASGSLETSLKNLNSVLQRLVQ